MKGYILLESGQFLSKLNMNKEGAGAFIFCKETNRYLFLLRTDIKYAGTWGLVGGKIEQSESIVSGLKREIFEETKLEISDQKIIPLEQFNSDDNNFIYHTFFISVDKEFIPNLNEEHNGYTWVPIGHFPKPMHPGLWRTINFKVILDKLQTLEQIF